MSDPEDENYVFYGTALQEEVESRAGQHSKALQDPSLTKSLPVWKQEVTDAEGRRRFHGAFTGGYSAGFYNTVGSLEGWQPKTFKSSRDKRASDRQQNVEDFMDEDELAVLQKSGVKTKADYDTFGDTAAELAQRAAAADAQARPSAIPGAIFQDLIAPVPDSVGIRLLQKMGWRQGKGIGTADTSASGVGTGGGSRWGRVAGVGVENTPLYALKPKDTLHGLGFDPFKDAEVFRRAKSGQQGQAKPPAPGTKRTRGVAFGSGAADEDDSYGMMEDYVADDGDRRKGLLFEIAEGSDKEDLPMVMGRRAARDEPYRLTGTAAPLAIASKEHGRQPGSFIAGFIQGAGSAPVPVFPPPNVPANYQPVHKFMEPLRAGSAARTNSQAPAQSAAAPTDATILRNINTLARYVSKNGPGFEQIARVRNAADPSFAFLRGGEGAAYYAWKVQQLSASPNQLQSASAVARRSTPLSADNRGSVLGETALPSSAPTSVAHGPALMLPPEPVKYSGFVPSGSQSARPNLAGIAEGDRSRLKNLLASNFQQPSADTEAVQKPILQAGLQHRAVATAPVPAASAANGVSAASAQAMVAAMANRFASSGAPQVLGIPQGGLEIATAKPPPTAVAPLEKPAPTRSVEEWRPAALLCKRFNVMDPYKGKADRTVQMSRFKTDYLALPDTLAAVQSQQASQIESSQPRQQEQLLPAAPQHQQQQQQHSPQQHQQQQQPQHQHDLQLQEVLPGPPPRPATDASTEAGKAGELTADAFLSSLGLELAAENKGQAPTGQQQQQQQQQGQLAPEELQQTALDKPIDLFKAIFENEDDTSEGEEASDAEQEAAPLQPPPPATAAAAAAMADPHDPQTLQQHTGREPQMELPRAVKTGEAQQPWAEASPMQRHQQAATERVEQPFSESQGPLLHQAAAPLQAPGTQEASELRRDHSSVKKRKHREEEKQKSHKKKHKKGKDRKSSERYKKKKHKRRKLSATDSDDSSANSERS